MAETISIERIVEAAVSRILETRIPLLREDLVRAVAAELSPELEKFQGDLNAPAESAHNGNPADLLTAISAIHTGSTQKEILRALLDCTVRYCGRTALFVIKSGMATGWQGRGFESSETIKDFSLDLRTGVAAQAMQNHVPCQGTSEDIDPRFVTHFRAPADDHVLLLPLLLKDKVSALVYTDAGVHPGSKMDVSALQLLVVATSAWLEVISLRKQHKEVSPEISDKTEAVPSASAVPSIADPFATHSPAHAPKHRASEPVPMAMAASAPSSASVTTATATVVAPALSLSNEDQETHKKAQRFARLLMDELKLYNQPAVMEGRRNHDLYDRLKEDIEKSRATYQKRYGNTAAAEGDYFNQELVHILAEGDVSLLGVNYRH